MKDTKIKNHATDESVSINIDGKETEIKLSQLPQIIEEKSKILEELEKAKDEAEKEAGAAKELAEKTSKPSVMNRTKTIDELQKATLKTANALDPIVKAQTKSFEFQQKLSEMCNFLLTIGLYNTAMRNVVVREIKLRLQHATEEKVNDLYKKELQNVIDQLQAQELTEKKIEKVTDYLEIQDKKLCSINEKDDEQDKSLAEQENRIGNIDEKNVKQDAELARQALKDKEHDSRLDAEDKKNIEQDFLLTEYENRINAIDVICIEHENQLNLIKDQLLKYKENYFKLKMFAISSGIVGIIGFVFGIINLLF